MWLLLDILRLCAWLDQCYVKLYYGNVCGTTIDSFLFVGHYKVAEETESICLPKQHTCSTIQRDTDLDSRATLEWQIALKQISRSEQNWCRMHNLGRKIRQNSHWICLKSKTVIWPFYWMQVLLQFGRVIKKSWWSGYKAQVVSSLVWLTRQLRNWTLSVGAMCFKEPC